MRRWPAPKLSEEQREYLGMMSHLIWMCEQDIRHGPGTYTPWDNLPKEARVKFRRIAISSMEKYRKYRPLTMDETEVKRRETKYNKEVVNWTEAQSMQEMAAMEMSAILRQAEDEQTV